MAHPKRKTSNQRRDKRRTHQKIASPMINPPHQAEWKDGNLYYKGALIIEKKASKEGK